MTLSDFLDLAKRYKKVIISPILICVIIAIAISLLSPPSYLASASIVLNGDLAFAKGLATKEATSYTNLGASVSIDSNNATKQISFNASGTDPTACVEAANSVMDSTIPIGEPTAALIVSKELAGAFERGSINTKLIKGSAHIRKFKVKVPDNAAVLACCEPITAGMGTAYIAHHSDTTLLCIRGWVDNKRQLETTIKELQLANADIAGIAFLPEETTVRTKRAREESIESRKNERAEYSAERDTIAQDDE